MKQVKGTFVVLTMLIAILSPSAADAHQGNPDFRSEITSITPSAAADGLQMEIQNFDDHIELVNRTGKEVIINGYDKEPYIRISPDGTVKVNLNSPSYYLNEDRYANVDVPARADAKAEPDWKQVDDTGRYVWHDHRSHYMGLGTPPQVKDESKKTEVFPYVIPMTVGGVPVKAHGTLTWVGKESGFPVLPFVLLAALVVAGAVAIPMIRRRREEGDGPAPDGSNADETTEGKTGDSPGKPDEERTEAW